MVLFPLPMTFQNKFLVIAAGTEWKEAILIKAEITLGILIA